MTTLGIALSEHKVSASVIDVDHYSIKGGLAVETDYIVEVVIGKGSVGNAVETFKISKKYSEFRDLASAVKKAAEIATSDVKKSHVKKKSGDWKSLPEYAKRLVRFAESLSQLVESERTTYLGKLTYTYVKSISKHRRSILNQALDIILERYPSEDLREPGVVALTKAIETFFLTDHVEEDIDETSYHSSRRKLSSSKLRSGGASPQISPKSFSGNDVKPVSKPQVVKSPVDPTSTNVVPISRKARKSLVVREQEDKILKEVGAKLTFGEEKVPENVSSGHKHVSPSSSSLNGALDSPFVFALIAAAAIYALHFTSHSTVTVESDIALFIGFACFCLGLHSPSKAGAVVSKKVAPKFKKSNVTFQNVSATRRQSLMLRRSMMHSMKSMKELSAVSEDGDEMSVEDFDDDEEGPLQLLSPLPTFPKGAELGTVPNCVSETPPSDYKVRGAKYFSDKKKIASGPFLFPFRGVDLFLTDLCPENVGSNPGAMGGNLRDKPTFIVNFRLPWAVLLFYAEIPAKLLPFLRARYESDFDKSSLPSTEAFNPSERSAARFLMGNDAHKNESLKIVPVVVKGPWVVKSVVGGKPAIIGTKMPVSYFYQPAEKGRSEYLEMDLDICASSAARGILSVVKNYTSALTLDLGFVVEGKREDELPEQMMVGTRLHSIDPLTAPPLPPMKDLLYTVLSGPVD